jgi:hypothetical protein
MNKKIQTPLSIFPEGTVTSGRHMLKLKRGAFQSLLPIKPILFKIDENSEISISVGVLKFWFHYILFQCYFYHNFRVVELPIIAPTDFMFANYSHLGKEKWEVYSNVVREIYCECGNLQKSNKSFNDMLDYLSILNGKKILNT